MTKNRAEQTRIELDNYVRELEKSQNALEKCELLLRRQAQSNAALHMADEIIYSPLYGEVVGAIKGIRMVLRTWKRKIIKEKVAHSISK